MCWTRHRLGRQRHGHDAGNQPTAATRPPNEYDEEEEMTTQTDRRTTKRTDEHAAMLKEALARPGVREVMEVHGAWRLVEKELDAYRAATATAPATTTTDRANPWQKLPKRKIAVPNGAGIRVTPQAGNAF